MTGASLEGAIVIRVVGEADVERARREARGLALALGFGLVDAERVTLTASELARNLLRYARDGEIVLCSATGPRGAGVQVESRDRGPGIPNVEEAMRDGYSTGGGLGNGLPGVRRLTDEFTLETAPAGTRIVTRSWPAPRS